jgi:hypothetical protein
MGRACRRFCPECAPSLLVPLWSVGGVAIGVDKLAVTRPVPEGEAVRLIPGWRYLPTGNSMLTIIWHLLSDAMFHSPA